MLPTSSRRIPGDPVERRHQFRVAELGFGVFDRRLIGFDPGLFLSDLRSLRGDLLLGCKPLFCQRDISAEIDPPIFEMGLIAAEISLRLVELRLIGARIELGQELAFFDQLAIFKVDADDLLGDHASDCRRVQRRDIANPGQHDRKVLRLDCCSDDGNGGCGLRRGSAGAAREMLPSQVTPRDDRDHHEADDQRRAAPALRRGWFGYNW